MFKAGLVVGILASSLRIAAANVDMPPPPPPPGGGGPGGAPAAPGVVPVALTDRTIMLPENTTEIDGSGILTCLPGGTGGELGCPDPNSLGDFFDLQLVGRHSFGSFEAYAGGILALTTPKGYETLDTILLGGRAKLGTAPGDLKMQFSYYDPSSSTATIWSADLTYEFKQTITPQKLAIVAEAGIAYLNLSQKDTMGNGITLSVIPLVLRGAIQAQATPEVALEAGGQLRAPISHSEPMGITFTPATLLDLYAMGLYGMGKLDVYVKGQLGDLNNHLGLIGQAGVLARF